MLANHLQAIKPTLTICATEAMAAACDGVYLPHHSRPGLTSAPVREDVTTVAYEGNPSYLGRWHGWVADACAKRGWAFVMNPASLADADVVVAFRDGPWDGWICREWKSGVKVVNAIAAGRPLISQDCAAVRELQPIGEVIESPDQLSAALDKWTPRPVRQFVATKSAAKASLYSLSAVAEGYLSLLLSRGLSCAA